MALNDSEAPHPFQTLIDNLPIGVSLIDRDLRYVAWNTQFKRLLDYPDEIFDSEAPEVFQVALRNARRRGDDPGEAEKKIRAGLGAVQKMLPHAFERERANGTIVEINCRPTPDGGIVTTYSDITQRKRADDELQRTASYFRTVLSHLPFGVAVTDMEMRIAYWNDTNADLYGLPQDMIREGMSIADVSTALAGLGHYGPGNLEEQVALVVEFIGQFQPYERESPRPGGGVLLLRGVPVFIDDTMIGFVHLAEDISERKAYQETLEHQATTDHLTGLLNRRAFFDAAEKEIRRAQRFRQPVSLLLLDIDQFKSINDTYGHPLGDEVLRQVGAKLEHVLRDEDIPGRIGGEEFSVVLVQMALSDALAIAERVRQALAAIPIDAGKIHFSFTASIGIATIADDADNLDKLIAIADRGLYEAKRSGRNRIYCVQAGTTADAFPGSRR